MKFYLVQGGASGFILCFVDIKLIVVRIEAILQKNFFMSTEGGAQPDDTLCILARIDQSV